MSAPVAEKQKKEEPFQAEEDDYYSEGGSDYDSYSDEDPDEPITESDAENEGGQLQRRRKPRGRQYYDDDDEDDDEDDYSDEYDDDDDYDDDAVAPYQGNAMQQQGGGKMELASDAKKGIDDEEGLKLKLEVNLDVEIELKAAIHGDLTLSLLA